MFRKSNNKPVANRLKRSDLIGLSACTRCGDCVLGCPVYEQTGESAITARAKIQEAQRMIRSQVGLLARLRGPRQLTEAELREMYSHLADCTGCAACRTHCPSNIVTDELWVSLRSWLHDQGIGVEGNARIPLDYIQDPGKGNPFGESHEDRAGWIPKNLREERICENLYFVGCVASHSMNRLAKSVVKTLESAEGFEFTVLGGDEYCCGDPLARAGYVDEAKKLQEHNLEAFRKRGVRRIFTACAGCNKTLHHFCPPEITVQHVSELYADLIREGKLSISKEMAKKAIFFDGCDLGRHAGIYEPPRDVVRAIPGIELLEYKRNREEGMCCGGPLMSSDPERAKQIAMSRVREAQELGAEVIITSCPACMLNLKNGAQELGSEINIQDLPMLLPTLVKK